MQSVLDRCRVIPSRNSQQLAGEMRCDGHVWIFRSRYASESTISDLADEIAITWTHRRGVLRARGQTATIYMTIIKKEACCARLFTVHRLTPRVRGEKGRERKKEKKRGRPISPNHLINSSPRNLTEHSTTVKFHVPCTSGGAHRR